MNVPKNVLWFEVLLYLSLTLDAVSVAFQDRMPNANMTEQMINVGTVMAAGLILLLVYFVWLAAERRKRSEEHTSELQSHSDLHSFPTRRSSDLERQHDGADDQCRDRDGGRPDPAFGLLRLARRRAPQELATLGAGGSAGAVGDFPGAADRREGPGVRQRHRGDLLRADGDGAVLLVHRRRGGVVRRLSVRRVGKGAHRA